MDILVAGLLGLVQGLFGLAGALVSLKEWSQRARIRFAIGFGILTAAGLGFVVWQAVLAHQSGESATKSLLGDGERPPFVSIISLPGNIHFVTTNSSDFPAYGTKIQVHDETHKASALRSYDYPEMAAHLAVLDDKPWAPDDDASEHRFTAEIVTRAGLASEEIILRRAGNNQWMRACRVQQGMRTLEEDVDSSWPRDDQGQVEWK
jgi:hypothetical protein